MSEAGSGARVGDRNGGGPLARLDATIAREQERSVEAPVRALAEAVRVRHGDAVDAVVFYGSCLRKQSLDGVLDFYVLVEDYRAAYRSRILAWINRLVPPNVFFLEQRVDTPDGPLTLRCKYAVLSRAAFEHGVSPESRVPYFWARFAQPVAFAWARDDAARARVRAGCVQAVVTLARRLSAFLPHHGEIQRFSSSALWQTAFAHTYRSELRPESAETIRSHYASDAARYDALSGDALEALLEQGWLRSAERRGEAFEVEMDHRRRVRTRLRWHLEWPLCKALAFVRLVKNASTFGDWVPYILWKIERHTGRPVEVTERQRKHPFVFGWPVLARLLWRRDIF